MTRGSNDRLTICSTDSSVDEGLDGAPHLYVIEYGTVVDTAARGGCFFPYLRGFFFLFRCSELGLSDDSRGSSEMDRNSCFAAILIRLNYPFSSRQSFMFKKPEVDRRQVSGAED